MSKLFKTKREDLGKKIGEVAAGTRIKESSLAAIEDEDYDKLPIEVYARGYIKEYAKFLGLPVEDGLAPYEKYLELKKGPKEKKQTAPATESPAAVQKGEADLQEKKADEESFCLEASMPSPLQPEVVTRPEAKPYGSSFIWKGILLMVVALAIVYQFLSSRNAEQEPRFAPPPQQVQPPQEVSQPPAEPVQPAYPAAGEMKTTGSEPVRKKHELVISSDDTSWVQVTMDGSDKKEALMKPGDTLTAEADNTIRVIVGNAGGVSMKFDGRLLPAGKKGEVLKLTLPEVQTGEKSSPDNISQAQQKTPAQVKRETPMPKKLPEEKVTPNSTPEQPASTSKP